MKKYFKYFLALIVGLFLVVGLTACGESDQQKVDDALEKLAIVYTAPDNKDSVTKDLTLRTAIDEVSIEWKSDKPAVVSNTGRVTRPAASGSNETVTLTATASLGKVEVVKTFKVVVIKLTDFLAVLQGIELAGVTKDNNVYVTSKDITLPATVGGHNITWVSADPETITNAGVVTRPKYLQPDKVVALTASTGGESIVILVKVLAIAEEPKIDILNQAKDMLLLTGVNAGVVADDIELPKKVGQKGVTITWSSDTPDSISATGEVSRSAENVTVTLTATLNVEGYTGDPITKEFEIVVLAAVESVELTALSEMRNLGKIAKGTYVSAKGVTVVGTTKDGFMIYDGETLVFVYDRGVRKSFVKTGQVIDISGETSVYYGVSQLQNSAQSSKPIIVKRSTAAKKTPTPTTIKEGGDFASIEAFLADKGTTHDHNNVTFDFEYLEISAYVRKYSSDNYDTVLVDDASYKLQTSANSALDKKGFVVYYQSNQSDLQPYDNVKVTIKAFFYSYRTDRNVFSVIYTGGASAQEIVFNGTDAEFRDVIGNAAKAKLKERYIRNETAVLLDEFLGGTIAWASDDPASINPTTGAVVIPAAEKTVNLTATVSYKGGTTPIVIPVKLGVPAANTVADLIAADENTTLRVVGVVTGYVSNNTHALQDTSGAIALDSRNLNPELRSLLDRSVGKTVDMLVTRKRNYRGLEQAEVVEIIEVTDALELASVSLDDKAIDNTLKPDQSKYVSFSSGIVSNYKVDNYNNITFTLTNDENKKVNFRWDARTPLATSVQNKLKSIKNGDKFNVSYLLLGWFDNPQVAPSNKTKFVDAPYTDAQAMEVTANKVKSLFKAQYYKAEDISLFKTNQGVAVAWASDNANLFNAKTGMMTLPAAGTAPVEVKVTATLTKEGVAAQDVVVKFEVGALLVVSVADAKAQAKNRLVKIKGVLTANAAADTYFVQDATGAIAVYAKDSGPLNIAELDKSIGHEVTIQGSRSTYKGMEQINLNIIWEVSEAAVALPAAVSLDTGLLDAATLKSHQSKLASISQVVVSSFAKDDSGNVTFTLTRPDLATINFRWESAVELPEAMATLLNGLENDAVLNIEKAIIGWIDNPVLLAHKGMTVTKTALTDANKVKAAKATLVAELEGQSFIGGKAVVAPTKGLYDASLTWKTPNPADAVAGGKWKAVEAETPVVLTVTVKVGNVSEDQTINVIIVPNVPQVVTTSFTVAKFESLKADENNATSVGLDPAVFNVVSVPDNSNGNHVGLATDGNIRLYASRADGKGSALTISVLGDQKIKRVKFVLAAGNKILDANNPSAKITLGTEEKVITGAAQLKDTTIEYNELDITTFTFQHTQLAAGQGYSSTQIWIQSIEIEYLP
ncbi:MAG: immunoglobulin-like domain-containing protein [Acholeplasmataceae bacterium]|jgi:uncharacterized protein YdeI (BOF family)